MQKRPPQIKTPSGTNWSFYLEVDSETTIWFLRTNATRSPRYLPVRVGKLKCDLPSVISSMTEDESQSLSDRDDRYFWSEATQTLIVQLHVLRDYSQEVEIQQIEFAGDPLSLQTCRGPQSLPLRLLPDQDSVEVYRVDLRDN